MTLQVAPARNSRRGAGRQSVLLLRARHARLMQFATILHQVLRDRGGGTIDPGTDQLLGSGWGYVVSIAEHGRCFPSSPTRGDILEWLLDVQDVLNSPGRKFYPGIWRDDSSGEVSCDLNVILDNQAEAIQLGLEQDQKCIFGLHEQRSIPLCPPLRRAA